ncbi:MAG: hypothetical protein ACKOWG_06915 [Planctomycetia bacterium]
MSSASMRSTGFATDEDSSSKRRAIRWLLVLLAVALLALLIAWLLGYVRLWTDPRIVEIQKLQAEAQKQFAANGGPQTLDEANAAVAAMAQIREKIEALPESMQREAGRRGGNVFRATMRTRIDAYFSLPPEKRQAELDRQIKQEELFRKAWEASRPAGGRPGGGVASAAAGNGAAGAAPGTGAGGGPGGAGGGPGGGDGGGRGGPGGRGFGGPPRNGTEEDRNRWRKNMIDSTTPEQRAKYVEYRRAMEARREQLGMQPAGPR